MSEATREPESVLKPLTPVRKAIGERVTSSFRDVPQFDLHAEADATAFVNLRQKLKAQCGDEAPGFNDMLILCIARCLRKYPALNAHFCDGAIQEFSEINVGFAVATEMGVLLPVVREADRKGLSEIAALTRERFALAKQKKLRASFQMHGTFTLSSLGAIKIDSFNAIISPPQVAILAAGAIIKKPWVAGGTVAVRDVIHLTLTVDHRAVDGADAAPFLAELRTRVETFTGE
jgi:pyruvate dehydrogenase E2 component (dihydrolipoamide acetyltransferase)